MINAPAQGNKKDVNFWEWNPECVDLFCTLHDKDKSKKKSKSSKIMWALYYKLNPDSIYYNLSDKDEVIKTRFLKDPKFDWNKYSEEEEMFKRMLLTAAEQALYDWNELMVKRNRYLKAKDYYFDEYQTDENGDNVTSNTGKPVLIKGTAKQLDEAHNTTIKYYNDYSKILKELKEDKLKKGKAGKPLSASDAGRI